MLNIRVTKGTLLGSSLQWIVSIFISSMGLSIPPLEGSKFVSP
jgi:hypothetical protein